MKRKRPKIKVLTSKDIIRFNEFLKKNNCGINAFELFFKNLSKVFNENLRPADLSADIAELTGNIDFKSITEAQLSLDQYMEFYNSIVAFLESIGTSTDKDLINKVSPIAAAVFNIYPDNLKGLADFLAEKSDFYINYILDYYSIERSKDYEAFLEELREKMEPNIFHKLTQLFKISMQMKKKPDKDNCSVVVSLIIVLAAKLNDIRKQNLPDKPSPPPKGDIRQLITIADQETRKGNFNKAIAAYEESIKLAEKDKENKRAVHISYWGIGDIYLNNKQYDKAEFYLKKAVDLSPDEAMYHYLLGCTYTYKKEIDKAVFHLEKTVDLDDSKDIYWGQLGWVVGYNCDVNKGIEYLKKSLSLNPKNTHSLKDICMLYTKEQKFNEALVCIEEAEKLAPDNEEVVRLKQDVEFFKKEFERLSKKK